MTERKDNVFKFGPRPHRESSEAGEGSEREIDLQKIFHEMGRVVEIIERLKIQQNIRIDEPSIDLINTVKGYKYDELWTTISSASEETVKDDPQYFQALIDELKRRLQRDIGGK